MTSSAEPPLAILSAPGSRGDVNPMVAIGRSLRRHGFDVVISLAEPYAAHAEAAGLTPEVLIDRGQFDALLGRPEVWQPLSGLRTILQKAAVDFLEPHFELITRRLRPGRTVLVSHPLDFASRIHRELDASLPLADIFLSPAMIRSPEFPPLLTPWWFEPRRPAWLVRAAYRLGDRWLLDRYLAGDINRLRARHGLPPVRRVMDRWWLSPDLILSLYPSWFGPTPPPSDAPWHACGFPLAVNQPTDCADPELEDFIKSSAPIFFTPGTAHRHAQEFFAMADAACRTLGRGGIFATTHREQVPDDLSPSVRVVGYVPLDRVLPHCSAIVHHGGIGTTAQAIAGACPQLILPMAFDQFHNAWRVEQLGLGRRLPRPSLKAVLTAFEQLGDAATKAKCIDAAHRCRVRDGADEAADRIAALLPGPRER